MFFGSQNGIVYALNARNGSVVWTYHAAGAVKASPTLSGGVLYFGDYSGHVQAISEQTGRRLWVSGSEGALLGSGTFYSTAAVVYGRVFLGNTDGRIYAYDAFTGRLDWAVQTGAYVYASPAVTNAPGLGPTIYLGSYDGTFYALNARSGQIAWSFNAHGRISGSATIVGRTVYFADLGERRTYGLGISTGRVVFEKDTGLLRPGDQRRREHLPDRLHRPVRAGAGLLRTAGKHAREQVAGHRDDAWIGSPGSVGRGLWHGREAVLPAERPGREHERARARPIERGLGDGAAGRCGLQLARARHAGAGAQEQRARRRGGACAGRAHSRRCPDAGGGRDARCRRTATTA